MPDKPSSTARALDVLVVQRQLRRQALGAGAPWLHQEVARRMAKRLPVIRLQPALLLDWWSGPGGSAELLAATYPQARRVAIEGHEAWLQRRALQGHIPWWLPKRWAAPKDVALLETDALPQGAELIWSNMMLHAVVNPMTQIEHWHRTLDPGGFLMFSCLGPGSLQTLRRLYRDAFAVQPTVDFVDMHDLGDMLVQAGFADPVMDQEQLTLTWASPQALLTELRGMGANAHPERIKGLRTPRWYQDLLKALEMLRGADGRLHLQFEISYGHAFKGQPRFKVQAQTHIGVDELRTMARGGSRPSAHN
jgi:malonyl-CoA O-methyltransferase